MTSKVDASSVVPTGAQSSSDKQPKKSSKYSDTFMRNISLAALKKPGDEPKQSEIPPTKRLQRSTSFCDLDKVQNKKSESPNKESDSPNKEPELGESESPRLIHRTLSRIGGTSSRRSSSKKPRSSHRKKDDSVASTAVAGEKALQKDSKDDAVAPTPRRPKGIAVLPTMPTEARNLRKVPAKEKTTEASQESGKPVETGRSFLSYLRPTTKQKVVPPIDSSTPASNSSTSTGPVGSAEVVQKAEDQSTRDASKKKEVRETAPADATNTSSVDANTQEVTESSSSLVNLPNEQEGDQEMLKIAASNSGVREPLPQLRAVPPKVTTAAQTGLAQLNGSTDAPETMNFRDRMALAEKRSTGTDVPKAAVLLTPGSPKSPKKSDTVAAVKDKGAPRALSPVNLPNGEEGSKEAAPLASTNSSTSVSSPKLTPQVVRATIPQFKKDESAKKPEFLEIAQSMFGKTLEERNIVTNAGKGSTQSTPIFVKPALRHTATKFNGENTEVVAKGAHSSEEQDVTDPVATTTQKTNYKALAMFAGLPAAFLLVTGGGYLAFGAFASTLITVSGYTKTMIAQIYAVSGLALALIASFACDARKARPSAETPDVTSTSWKVNINAKSALLGVAAAFLLVTGFGFFINGAFVATLIPISSLSKATVATIYVASGAVFVLLATYFAFKKSQPSAEASDVDSTAEKVRESASPILGQEAA